MNNKALYLACLIVSAAGESAAAAPSQSDWARCADIDGPAARLSCYDALFHRVPRPASTANVEAPLPPAAVAATAPAPALAPAPPPPPAARVPYDPKNFGFTAQQSHVIDAGPKSITVHITGVDADQNGHTLLLLDNDQTWSVVGDDGRLAAGDKVSIRHAALGAFIMLTRSNHTYHVRRVH